MKHICIGVHVHEEPDRLLETLESVRRNTASTVQLIVLPDGPDARMRRGLGEISDIPQFGMAAAAGAAACFNRLASASAADIVVMLESGSMVSPGWLEHLLAALECDPRNGLAGPSTNYSWNEQCVFRGSGNSPAEIANTARAAVIRFGEETRVLEPLYSLAEFCYAVRREVIEDVGVADEGYGLGPCWEMDYNIRAARAGWRGVWACAAYVHRASFTPRRQFEEELRFEASKHRYQDKFCGARLRGEKTDYRTHCRGDMCPNFAPAEMIEIKRTLTSGQQEASSQALQRREGGNENSGLCACPEEDVPQGVILVAGAPLVSSIMPTSNRRRFIPQAVQRFLRQDYPNLELIIVDDGPEPVADCLPVHPHIRYFSVDQRLTVGAKRNIACRQARGEFIAHWDDDDWYGESRVSRQIEALHASSADICGSSRIYFYAPATEQAWEYCYAAPGSAWVAGSTMVYRKQAWERSPFPDLQVGEDSHFVFSGGGKMICDLAAAELCVAMAHAGNTSHKDTAGAFWRPQSVALIERLLGTDIMVFRALLGPSSLARWPLVSCIMPTYNRRPFLPLALRCFLDQDYPNKELIIVDDGKDQVNDLIRELPNVRYFSLSSRHSIGAKRNVACTEARGTIIAHWDDDDWYAPERLRYQTAPIIAGDAEITGLQNSFVMALPGGEFWTMKSELHRQAFFGDVHGGTLVYRRESLAKSLRYPEVSVAEDAWLLHQALASGGRLLKLRNAGVFVYVRHGNNAWNEFTPGQFIDPSGWARTHPPLTLPGSVLRSYQTAYEASEQLVA